MELTEQVKKDINLAVNRIAEGYQQETQYDDDGHAYDMRWADCVQHGVEDFRDDIKGNMLLMDYELTDEECDQIDEYARTVNWETIWNYV